MKQKYCIPRHAIELNHTYAKEANETWKNMQLVGMGLMLLVCQLSKLFIFHAVRLTRVCVSAGVAVGMLHPAVHHAAPK